MNLYIFVAAAAAICGMIMLFLDYMRMEARLLTLKQPPTLRRNDESHESLEHEASKTDFVDVHRPVHVCGPRPEKNET